MHGVNSVDWAAKLKLSKTNLSLNQYFQFHKLKKY